MKEIYLSGGSFWGLQKYFNMVFGVISTDVGYINGYSEKTNYTILKKTGHAQAVHIIYNNNIISLEQILQHFYNIINPISYDKQGENKGREFRLGVYCTNNNDLEIIINSLEKLEKTISGNVAIDVQKVINYVKAENFLQNFLVSNPFAYTNIDYYLFDELKIKQSNNPIYRVMKLSFDEKPYSNNYYKNFKPGIYVDIENNIPLFSSKDKYNAKTGFPSFVRPIDDKNIVKNFIVKDYIVKVEISTKKGKNHIGYLYFDGPYGYRYSINSCTVKFIPITDMVRLGYEKYLSFV